MNTEIVQYQGNAISTVQEVVSHTLRVKEIMQNVMKKDVHYGVIPGTNKPTLYKPGAEVLCVTFHIAPTYPDVKEERFSDRTDIEGVRYRVVCAGIHQSSGNVVATGLGSANSHEEKYKWCKAWPREWDATDPSRRRLQYGWDKSAKKEYEIKQVRVETADIENTLLKMACKRAFTAMVLNALAASDVFAQDLGDLSDKAKALMAEDEGAGAGGDGGTKDTDRKKPQSKSKPAEGEAKAAGNGEAAATSDAEDGPASPAMLAHLKKRMENAALTDKELFKKLGITTLDGLKVKQLNAALHWVANPAA